MEADEIVEQSRRVENIASKTGCARCDGVGIEKKAKLIMAVEAKTKGRGYRSNEAQN
jgi:hypothetical protein